MKYLNIFCLLLFVSCMNNNEVSKNEKTFLEFDLKVSSEWIYTTKLENLKYNDQVITRPPGFEQLIMSLTIPAVGGQRLKKQCFYYTIPYKEKIGNIKVQELAHDEACPDISEKGGTFAELSNVDHLKVSFVSFKLKCEFEYQKQKRVIEIPMPNIEAGVIHEKYQPMKEKSLLSGLKLLRLNEDSFDFATNKYLGKISDRFSRGNAIRCQQVNKDCETVGENRCGECRYGWYEVVDFQCPQGGSKFCGQNHCGEKNEPACPRGVKVVDQEEAGICQSDLEPILNVDKILVCQ